MESCLICGNEIGNSFDYFCGGGHCENFRQKNSLDGNSQAYSGSCPYCSKRVNQQAIVCSTCGGNLAVGSPLAIKQAILTDPTLVANDSESLSRLKVLVESIDLSMINEEKKQAQLKIQQALEQQELEAAKKAERDKYIQALPPRKRFYAENKNEILIFIMLIFSLIFFINENNKSKEEEQIVKDKVFQAYATAKNISNEFCKVSQEILTDEEYQRNLRIIFDLFNEELDDKFPEFQYNSGDFEQFTRLMEQVRSEVIAQEKPLINLIDTFNGSINDLPREQIFEGTETNLTNENQMLLFAKERLFTPKMSMDNPSNLYFDPTNIELLRQRCQ